MDGVVHAPAPTIFNPLRITIDPGRTVAEILHEAQVPEDLWDRVIVLLNGRSVRDFNHILTQDGDVITLGVVPAGGGGDDGKGTLATLAIIAIGIAAPYAAAGILGYATPAAATAATVSTGTQLAFHAITAGITLVGTLLISALIPPPDLGSGAGLSTSVGEGEQPVYALGGQSNTAKPFQTVPRVYGRFKMYPNLAATPNIRNVGKRSRITALYDFGIGDLSLSDLKVGDTPITTFSPSLAYHTNSLLQNDSPADRLQLIGRRRAYSDINIQMQTNTNYNLQTAPDSSAAVVYIGFPAGLARTDRSGNRFNQSVGFRVEFRDGAKGGNWDQAPPSWYKGTPSKGGMVQKVLYDLPEGGNPAQIWPQPDNLYSVPRGSYASILAERTGSGYRYTYRIVMENRVRWESTRDSLIANFRVEINGYVFRMGALREHAEWPPETENYIDFYELIREVADPSSSVIVTNKTLEPFVVAVDMEFDYQATWQIRVRRTTTTTDNAVVQSVRDRSVLQSLTSYQSGSTVNLKKPHTMVEVSFDASEQLNGVVQNLSAVVASRIRTIDANGWGRKVVSANPALIALDILCGVAARYPVPTKYIDFPAWNRLRILCSREVYRTVNGVRHRENQFRWSGVIDSDMSIRDALQMVLSVARASVRRTHSGLWSVVIDEEQTQPRQLITPENSWDFSGERTFSSLPDAFRVTFVDEDSGYTPASVLIPRTGYSENTAVVVEDLPTAGITSFAGAWSYGRYMMAQALLRSEKFMVKMDVEHLAVERGDLVTVQHDVPRFGGQSFRIVEANGTTITLNRPTILGKGDAYVVRGLAGNVNMGKIQQRIDDVTMVISHTVAADSIISLANQTRASQDYLVQAILPGEDLSAQLTLVRYDARVYTADSGPLPPWNAGLGDNPVDDYGPIKIAWVEPFNQNWVYQSRQPILSVDLRWVLNAGFMTYASAVLEAIVDNETYQIAELGARDREFAWRIPAVETVFFDSPITLRLTPYDGFGKPAEAIITTVEFATYDIAPLPPRNAHLDIRSEEVSLFWNLSMSPDVARYLIRYSPNVDETVTWNVSTGLDVVDWNGTETSVGARTGTYLLRAEGATGLLSEVVALRTTVESLPNLNLVERVTEGPTWPGIKSGFANPAGVVTQYFPVRLLTGETQLVPVPPYDPVVRLADGGTVTVGEDYVPDSELLVSTATWTESGSVRAVYTYKTQIDIGGIYEVRIQDKIESAAIDVSNITTFALPAPNVLARSLTPTAPYLSGRLPYLSDDRADDWDVWVEYRAIDEINYIASWPDLSSLPSMSQGTATFGEWRKIVVGDATGRIFEFRIVAIAYKPDIVIMIGDDLIELDMPDRVWRSLNIAVAAGGEDISFIPAFREPPVLALNLEGSGQANRYEAQNLTRGSVRIQLFDDDTPVSGQIDIAALGYGRQRAGGI